MFTVAYTVKVQPFVDSKMNYLDIFNECTIMFMAYATIPYSDYLLAPHFKYQIGWIVIGGLCLNLGVNVGFIVLMSLWNILKKVIAKFKGKGIKAKKAAKKYE